MLTVALKPWEVGHGDLRGLGEAFILRAKRSDWRMGAGSTHLSALGATEQGGPCPGGAR